MTDQEKTARYIQAVQEKKNAMYRAALSVTRQPADAEDAVSEALETVWKHLWAIRDPEAIPAYLMRSAINAARNQLRRKKREVVTDEFETVRPAEQRNGIGEYLEQLPEKYRLPLQLHYGEDMTIEETAKALGLRRGTVSSLVSRGLEQLRAQMKKENMEL